MKTANGVEKPLVEWTLEDFKEYCKEHQQCDTCFFKQSLCDQDPCYWKLTETPKFSKQEIEDAKTLDRLLGSGPKYIYRVRIGESVSISYNHTAIGCSYLHLPKESFPSVESGIDYGLHEIIGSADN